MLCGLLTPDEGSGTCLGYDIRTEAAKIKTRVGYMTQRFSLYEDLSVRENLEFVARIYGMPRPARGGQGDDRAARPARPRGADRRQAVGRLEAAACARRLHAAEPAAPAARRADRRRRPQGAARFLERDPRSSPPTASPCWSPPTTWTKPSAATRSPTSPSAKCSRAAPCSEVIANSHLTTFTVERRERRKSCRSSRASSRQCPASTWWRRSAPACTSPARDGAALEAAIAPYRDAARRSTGARVALARGRVHRPDGPRPGQFPMSAYWRVGGSPRRRLLAPRRRHAAARNFCSCGATASPSPP